MPQQSPLIQAYLNYAVARAIANGEDLDWGRIQALFADQIVALNRVVERVSGITNADGTLKNFPTSGALSLSAINRITATGGQTEFEVSEYDENTDMAIAFSGSSLIDTDSVELTDSTHVTLPAQTVGTVVTILVYTTGTALLSRLAATSTGDGAALIGVEDSGGLFASTNVETALAEAITRAIDLEDDLGDLSTILRADGSVPLTDDFDGGGQKASNFAPGTTDGDLVTFEQVTGDALVALISPVLQAFFLALAGGTMTGDIDMDGHKITGLPLSEDDTDAVSRAELASVVASSVPAGTVLPFAGTDTPDGFVLCDGTEYDGTDEVYADLFEAIGLTYGGSGSDFNVPDLRGRTVIGAGTGSGLTARTLGADGGAERHTLSIGEMPAHTHNITSSETGAGSGPSSVLKDDANDSENFASESRGGGNSHNNMQPYLVLNYIIKL